MNKQIPQWHCEHHDAGWLVQVKCCGKSFAYHLEHEYFINAHDKEWRFWSVIAILSRAVINYQHSLIPRLHCGRKEQSFVGVIQCGEKVMNVHTFQCQDCARKEAGYVD